MTCIQVSNKNQYIDGGKQRKYSVLPTPCFFSLMKKMKINAQVKSLKSDAPTKPKATKPVRCREKDEVFMFIRENFS